MASKYSSSRVYRAEAQVAMQQKSAKTVTIDNFRRAIPSRMEQ